MRPGSTTLSPATKRAKSSDANGGNTWSMKKPGRNSISAASSSSTTSCQRTLSSSQRWVAELNARMAISETMATSTPCQTLVTPISSSSGLNRKTNGSSAVRMS